MLRFPTKTTLDFESRRCSVLRQNTIPPRGLRGKRRPFSTDESHLFLWLRLFFFFPRNPFFFFPTISTSLFFLLWVPRADVSRTFSPRASRRSALLPLLFSGGLPPPSTHSLTRRNDCCLTRLPSPSPDTQRRRTSLIFLFSLPITPGRMLESGLQMEIGSRVGPFFSSPTHFQLFPLFLFLYCLASGPVDFFPPFSAEGTEAPLVTHQCSCDGTGLPPPLLFFPPLLPLQLAQHF